MASNLRPFPRVKPIPDGYHTITPYITVEGAAKLVEFLKQAFDAKEIFKMKGPKGVVSHAELKIGDSMLMLGEARAEWKPLPCSLYLYVEDCDATYKRAVAAGGKSLREPRNEFYGDRSAGVQDAFGNMWWIGTHIEDVPPEELERRAAAIKH